MADTASPMLNSARSSFLMSPSPSPEPPSRSSSPSFTTASSGGSPHKRKRHDSHHPQQPTHRQRHRHAHHPSSPSTVNSNITRSDSNSTVLSSGPFSSQSSNSTFYKERYGSSKSSTRTVSPNLKQDGWSGHDVACIGGIGPQERTMDMRPGGLRRRETEDLKNDDAYRRWLARTRATALEPPDSPSSAVSRRMYELGLVDHLANIMPPLTSKSTPDLPAYAEVGSMSTRDRTDTYYDILGEYEPVGLSGQDDGTVPRKPMMRYNLKALYSPCPTLTKEPVSEEMMRDPKLWPTMNASPSLQPSPSKRRRRSVSPPLAPRVVAMQAWKDPARPATAPVPAPISKQGPPPSLPTPTPLSPIQDFCANTGGAGFDPMTTVHGSPSVSSLSVNTAAANANVASINPASPNPSSPSQMRSSSPPLPAPDNNDSLTWHATEITGHLIDLDDPDDDGTGINGVGFRPTKQEEEMRRLKRKRQIEAWKKREEKEGRAFRWRRRAEKGLDLVGEGGGLGDGGRKVRFAVA